MTDSWSTIPNFTHYFGTALHGATFKFYNDPNGSGTTLINKTEMKIEFEQNLHSFVYTWWDGD